MTTINHDWDTTDPQQELEDAVEEYLFACYAGQDISPRQRIEVRQAFLSGIHWLNTKESYDPDELEHSLRRLLRQPHQ